MAYEYDRPIFALQFYWLSELSTAAGCTHPSDFAHHPQSMNEVLTVAQKATSSFIALQSRITAVRENPHVSDIIRKAVA